MSDIKSGSIKFRDYPPLRSDKEYKFEVLNSGKVIATAFVKCMQDQQGKFWELDAIDEALDLAMQQPDFWQKRAEINENKDSKKLFEWYRKREFTHDDPDGKHLWCYPK